MSEDNSDIKEMNFEQALEQLEAIVESLEQGNVALDKSIAHYERGEALRNHCSKLLKVAEDKVEKIRLDGSGNPSGTEPLDPA